MITDNMISVNIVPVDARARRLASTVEVDVVTLMKVLGSNVRQHRRARKMTQAQLAEAVELSVEMIGKVERGVTSPSLDKLGALASALGVPAAALLAEGAISEPAGARGGLLGRINDHLARTTDADLERVERMLGAFVRG